MTLTTSALLIVIGVIATAFVLAVIVLGIVAAIELTLTVYYGCKRWYSRWRNRQCGQ